MQVHINGECREIEAGQTVAGLLGALGFAGIGIAVERNGVIVGAADFGTTVLAEGDAIELIRFVGGG